LLGTPIKNLLLRISLPPQGKIVGTTKGDGKENVLGPTGRGKRKILRSRWILSHTTEEDGVL